MSRFVARGPSIHARAAFCPIVVSPPEVKVVASLSPSESRPFPLQTASRLFRRCASSVRPRFATRDRLCRRGESRSAFLFGGSHHGRVSLLHKGCGGMQGAGSVRCMSIMDRYRKLRPAPDPQPSVWTVPTELADDHLDADVTSTLSPDSSDLLLPEPPRRPPIYARAPVPSEALFCTWEEPVQPVRPRSLRIGMIGPPNAGKSALMNAFIDCPVSAVSPKVNTTRDGVRCIRTNGSTQLVFMDVPGIVPSHQCNYNRELVTKAWQGYQDCDICLLIIDVVKRPTQEIFNVVRKICPREEIGEGELRGRRRMAAEAGKADSWIPRPIPGRDAVEPNADGPPVILVLNKIDKAEEFRWVQSREREFRAHGRFQRTFYVSALKRQGLEKFLEFLEAEALPRPWTYPADMRTTLPHVEQVKHQINTFLFKWFNRAVPYQIEHQTLGWTPRLDGSLLVEHELIVSDSVVARMVCGVRNVLIARLRDQVSYKLKKMWGMPVEVQIWVRPMVQRISNKDRAERGVRPTREAFQKKTL